MTLQDLRNRALISVPEAAEVLGVSQRTAYRMAAADQLPVFRPSPRRVLVKAPALLKLLGVDPPTQNGPADAGGAAQNASPKRSLHESSGRP